MRRPIARHTALQARQANRFIEAMYGDVREARGIQAPDIPPERAPPVVVNRTDPAELEDACKKATRDVLANHHKVLFAVRVNSGAAWLPSKGGHDAPVSFHVVVRAPAKVRVVDFTGILRDGRPLAIECKRLNWTYTGRGPREVEQKAYLDMVLAAGGVAAFVTAGEQVLALLNRA